MGAAVSGQRHGPPLSTEVQALPHGGWAMINATQKSKLYEQVADRIGDAIATGTLRPGDRLPSVRQLSNQERVSISTVLQAYIHLESIGLVETRPQSGHY